MKRPPRPSPFALLAALALCGLFAVSGHAQEAAEGPQEPRVITRVYDIRDLLMQRRSYPAQSALVPPTRIGEPRLTPQIVVRATTQPDPAPQQIVGNMIHSLIQDTVDPESWRDNGGAIGALRELEGQLIVTQTAEYHELLV